MTDAESSALVEDYEELLVKYFRAKVKYQVDMRHDQLKQTTKELERDIDVAEELDPQMARRAEFMYSYDDYYNDRSKLRNKFLNEYHKKTTLQDIGKALD